MEQSLTITKCDGRSEDFAIDKAEDHVKHLCGGLNVDFLDPVRALISSIQPSCQHSLHGGRSPTQEKTPRIPSLRHLCTALFAGRRILWLRFSLASRTE